jgi:hypothetical protein
MNMSLGRLLAAGKSLVGLRGGESRYREAKLARLPKFISPKNPFAPAEKPAEQVVAAEITPEPAAKAGADEIAVALKIQPARIQISVAEWFDGWRQKLGKFRARRAKPGPVRSAGADSTARQSELALDRVQVVRNDLSEADLASAPASNPPPLMIRPVLPVMAVTMEKLEPVGTAWKRLATKFLGSDQT